MYKIQKMNPDRKSAFEKIYKEQRSRVVRLCRAYSGDTDEADDLAQEVFIKVWHHLDNFRNESTHSTWIYRIAINTCLSQIRKQKSKPIERLETTFDKADSADQSDGFQIALLYQAIAALPEKDRIILTLLLEDVSQVEMASILSLNEGTLRSLIHRGKKKLAEIYHSLEKQTFEL